MAVVINLHSKEATEGVDDRYAAKLIRCRPKDYAYGTLDGEPEPVKVEVKEEPPKEVKKTTTRRTRKKTTKAAE